MTAAAGALRARLLRGLSANFIGQVQNIAGQLLLVPVFLSCWGAARYGEWLLLAAVPTALTLADLGVGTAVANELVRRLAAGRQHEAQRLVRGAWAFIGCVGVATALVLLPLAHSGLLARLIGLGAAQAGVLSDTLPRLAAYALCCIATGLLTAPLYATQRYALGQNLNTGLRSAEMLCTAGLVWHSDTFGDLALGLLVARATGLLLMATVVRGQLPWLPLRPSLAAMRDNHRVLLSGLAFMSISLSNALFNQGVLLAIGLRLDSTAVAGFAIVRSLTRLVSQALNIVIQAFQPEVSQAHASGDIGLVRALCRRTMTWSFRLGAFACLGVAVAGPAFLQWWTRRLALIEPGLLWQLALVQAVTCIWLPAAVAVTATNRHHLTGLLLSGAGLAAALGSIPLARWGGIGAVAWWLLAVEVVVAAGVVEQACRVSGDTRRGLLAAAFAGPPRWLRRLKCHTIPR